MNRLMMVLCALVMTSAAQAKLNMLDVQLSPDVPVYAKGDTINVMVTANGVYTQYRYVLERIVNGQGVLLRATVWSSSPDHQIDTAAVYMPAGEYRLLVMTRENAARQETLSRYEQFSVIGTEDPNFEKVADRNEVVSNYEHAMRVVREQIARVKEKLLAHQDVSAEFNHFKSADSLIDSVINPEGKTAPYEENGYKGNAYLSAGASDTTGAIGIWITSAPGAANDWSGMTIVVDLPNYRGLDRGGWKHVTIRWED